MSKKIYFKPDHENPNDIYCPKCEEYKEFCYDKPQYPFLVTYVCPDCNTEVRIS